MIPFYQFSVDSDTQCTWIWSRVTCYHVSTLYFDGNGRSLGGMERIRSIRNTLFEADSRVSTFKMWNFN
jgi:hypothetical protein